MITTTTPDAARRPPLPDPLPLPVVDGHTHLDIPASGREQWPAHAPGDEHDREVAELLAQAASVGVPKAVQIGCDLPGARWTIDAIDRHPQLLGGVALHPNEAPRLAERGELDAAMNEIATLATHPRVRTVGETGLDYFRTGEEGRAVQQQSFRWHIDLAKRLGRTLQIHDRDAHDDVLQILADDGAPERTLFHCFSGDAAMARECVERGYHLSFSGTVTFKNAQSLREALAVTPLDRLQVETDAPFLTPVPFRGRPNAGYLVPLTVRAMAQVLCVDVVTLCRALDENAERLYGPW